MVCNDNYTIKLKYKSDLIKPYFFVLIVFYERPIF